MHVTRFRTLCAGLAFTAVALSGCRHASLPAPVAAGKSSFRFVEPPAPAPTGIAAEPLPAERHPVDIRVDAEPVEPLATPLYPPCARGAEPLPVVVGVRITVDARGRVSEVGPSLVASSTPGRFAPEFRSAVEAALAQWRFIPAELRHLVPARSIAGKEIWNVTRTEPTDCAFDLSFVFSVSSDVLASLPTR